MLLSPEGHVPFQVEFVVDKGLSILTAELAENGCDFDLGCKSPISPLFD